MKPLAVITGVGPGTGSALVRRFVKGGYGVAMLARSAERLKELEAECDGAFAVPCDVANPTELDAALARIEAQAGAPQVLVHNAVGGCSGISWRSIRPYCKRTSRSTSWRCCSWRAGRRR